MSVASFTVGGVTYDVVPRTSTPVPVPVPVPIPVPEPVPVPVTPQSGKTVAVYLMMWTASKSPRLASLPAQVNEVRLAFAQGDPPGLVGWASQSQGSFLDDVAVLKARGVRFSISVGGAGGKVNPRNRDAFIAGIERIHSVVGLAGLDWDVEASALPKDDVVAISQTLADRHGILSSFAPNGSNVAQYLPAAVECARRGVLSTYGQQFYDATVSLGAAMGRIDEAVRAGIPSSRIVVGTMVQAGSPRHWTVDQCVDNITAIRRKYPDLAGAYLWEAGRPGTAEWAVRIGALFGQ